MRSIAVVLVGPSDCRGCCLDTRRFELELELSFWVGEVGMGDHLLSHGEEVGLDWEGIALELSSVLGVSSVVVAGEERREEKGLRRG